MALILSFVNTRNGMIGELLAQKADLAVADLTITYEREQVLHRSAFTLNSTFNQEKFCFIYPK